MKVCILAKSIDPETGGLGRHVLELSNSLVDIGVDVTVYVREDMSSEQAKAEVEEISCLDLRQHVLNLYSTSYSFYKKLKKEGDKFDLIHGHGLVASAYSIGSGLGVPKKPFVYTLHGVQSEHVSRKYLKPLAKMVHHPETKNVGKADGLVAVSQDAKERAVERYGLNEDKVEVIYNGVDLSKFHSVSSFKNRLLFVGYLNERKGPDLLLNAFKDLKEEHGSLKLTYVGEGRLLSDLKSKVKKHNLEDSVEFLSGISEERLNRLYSESILVLPSAYEGLGLVYLESMACQSPAIGCKGTAISEVINNKENGVLVDRSVEDLKQGIAQLLENDNLREKIANKGKETSEKFEWEAIAEKTKQFYQKVINSS